MRVETFLFVILALTAGSARAEQVTIIADADATLIEDPQGAFANGAGPLFIGRTNQAAGSRRRAVLRFDVAGALPARSIVEGVELTLHLEPSNFGEPGSLHRLLADWSEGPTFSGGGGGRPSQDRDVTWIHTRYPEETWVRPGGQFVARPSATAVLGDPGFYTWSGDRHMLEDVRLWLHAPSRNFGWILIGDETLPQTARSFASREDPDEDLRPRLTIRYRSPGGL